MSWNNDDGPHSPWGQGSRPTPPPDMDKVFETIRQRFGGNMPGKRWNWQILAGVSFLVWIATGLYVVGPDEQGIVIRFGRYVQSTSPGPHIHLPYPIEHVYRPKVTQVERIEIGYRTRNMSAVDMPEESLMLTGDENIIDIDMSVQFRIKDAVEFLFNISNPPQDPYKSVRDAAETAIRQVVGRNSIDEALTTGKENIQNDTKKTMQEIMDLYKSGIEILAVQLQQVSPPEEVIHAFKDVASAREDRERAINEAEGYANDILPKAKGDAARVIQEAEGYKISKEVRAKGDVQRFLSMLVEFNKAQSITEKRLYLETMEEILVTMNKVIVDPSTSNGILPYLPLNNLATPGRGDAK